MRRYDDYELDFHDIRQFFRPFVDLVCVRLQDGYGVVSDFGTRYFVFQQCFCAFSRRFLDVLRARVIHVRRLVGVLFMFYEISIFSLPRRPFRGFVAIYRNVRAGDQTILRGDFPQDVDVFGIADFRYFIEGAAIQVAVDIILYCRDYYSHQGGRRDRGHFGFRYVWVLIIVWCHLFSLLFGFAFRRPTFVRHSSGTRARYVFVCRANFRAVCFGVLDQGIS